MKENSLDSHRGKVAESKAGAAAKQETTSATNFDDDYNEWELGIGDLIIDLDADIEKNNEKSVSGQGTGGGAGAHPIVQPQQPQQQQPPQSQAQQQASATAGATNTFSMASAKGGRMNTATVEHHATVDKGLKMKIKRTKPTKTSEAKHEIVKSDTKPASPVEAVNGTAPVATTPNAVDSKSKHVSSKGRGGSHREKKDRTKDKEKSVSSSKAPDVNGVMNTVSNATLPPPPPTATIKLTSSSVNMASISSPTVNLGIPTSVVSLTLTNTSNTPTSTTSNSGQHSGSTGTSNSLPSMPTLSVKLDPKFPILPNNSFPTVKTEDISRSVPAKRMRTNQDKPPPEKPVEKVSPPVDGTTSPRPPEMQDICIGTSVGTITDPDCLGPCEPGTSVTLEGIVWHETEGGVLVVNVTWRGKTYVGTLLDCTKHDWAPPRFCESPTSDVETRTPKGRGKRGRGGNNTSVDMTNYTETRSSVHSKLRNPGKGRRTNAPFPSPVKTEGSPIVGMKRKGRPPELELRESELRTSKRSRSQSRGASASSSTPPEHPSSPVLIECPKPNCKKRYRHINGLRYHQAHAHHESGSGVEDSLDEQTKDLSSDNEESTPESASVPQSPGATSEKNVRSSPRPFTGKAPPPPEKKSLSNPPPTSTATSVTASPSPTPTNSDTYSQPATVPCASAAGATPVVVTSSVTMPVASDLNTLATVAVSDSKTTVKVSGVLRFGQASPRQAATTVTEGDPATTLPTPPIASPVVPAAPTAVAASTIATPNATNVQGSQRAVASAPPSPASQVYQFTHAPIGSLTTTTVSTVRSPTTTATVSVATTNITSTTSVCSPPAVSANFNASTVAAAAAVVDKQKIKPDKPDKIKLKPPQPMPVPGLRPVGPPAVNPQMVGGPANLAVSPQQSTLVPGGVPVHPNLASNLKPIQPKVGIMGENAVAAGQVLDGTKKEKSKHKKKSKDKERKLGEISPSQPESKNQGLDSMDKLNGNVYSKMSDILLKEGVGEPVSPHLQNPNYPLTPLPRNVDSPLEVSTADGASTANENVQSPAYSDISDANDTAPVLESEVPSKEKEEEKAKVPSEPTPPPAHNLGPYGMYYSYRQPPYLVPSVPAQSSAQPAVVSGQVTPADKVKENVMDKAEVRMKEQQKQWGNEREQQVGVVVPATAEVEKKDGGGNSVAGVAANQTNMSEYQLQQQKLLQQQYAYQYGYSYPYSMDPTYHMQYMSDPQLKQQLEKCMEERERFYKDPFEQRQKQSSPKDPVDKSKQETVKVKVEASEKRKSCPSTEQLLKHVQQQMPVATAMSGKEREQRMPTQANKLDAVANPSLKEKQNENHQILKENIELKTQMDNKAKYDRFDSSKYEQMMYRPDDMQRYYQMYQEKYMDQQPKLDGSRRKDESLVPKPSLSEKSHCVSKDPTKQPPPSSHTSLPMSSPKTPSGPPKEPLALKEAVKKEAGSAVDTTKSAESSDAKDKREREADRAKQSEGQKPTMETQGPPPPTSSYAYMHPSYMQSSPYSTIPFDHSVYRNMLMTPGPYPSSPYLHPQMRYHVPQAEPQPDMTPKLHPSGPTKALDLLQHHASQYYTHKIHELQERALKSPPPAVIQPASNTKAVESSSVIKSDAPTPAGPHEQRRSPPLQRHLHTHHHTHVGVGVGVGYPINPIIGQYDPYATIIASQQAAAVAAASSSSTLK